jgi:hypothetical protein
VIPSEGRNGGRARPGVDPRSFRKRIAAARSPSSSPLALQSANEEEWIPQRRQATERRPAHRARSRRSGTGCEGRGSGYPARDASTAWPPRRFRASKASEPHTPRAWTKRMQAGPEENHPKPKGRGRSLRDRFEETDPATLPLSRFAATPRWQGSIRHRHLSKPRLTGCVRQPRYPADSVP